jgi:MFS transporter, ACS family, glucarate transporter
MPIFTATAAGNACAETTQATATASAYRWIILLLVWFGFLLSFVDRLIWTSVGSAAAPSFGLSLAALGSFVSAFYVGYVVSTALSGLASDRLGPRLTLTLALIPLGFFTFAFGSTTSVTTGLVLQALMGLTAGADFSAGVKLIMAWFDMRARGRAMGLFMTSTSLGVVVTNALVPHLLPYMPWGHVYQIAGLATSAFGVLCYVLIRDNPGGAPPPPRIGWSDLRAAMTNPQFIWTALAGMGGVWGTWGFAIWANALITRGLHLSAVTAGSIVAIYGVVAIIGKPAIGFLSDWLGGRRRILVMIDLFLFAALLLVTGTLSSETGLWIVAPLLGLTAFVYSPLQNAMAAEAGGNAAGTAAGVASALGAIGTSLVPLVVGIGFQATQSYAVAFAILALGPFLGALCMIPARDVQPS